MQESVYEGAGFIFLTVDNKILLLQKLNKKWTFPGGHTELYEEPKETATREAIEELGIVPKGKIVGYFKYIKPDTKGKCFSFLMKIQKEFTPKLSNEHLSFKWVSLSKIQKYNISKSVTQIIPLLQDFLNNH